MKKDRNCSINMPVYPAYMPNMMPGIPMNNMMYNPSDMGNIGYPNSYQDGTLDQQVSSLNSKINSLERRISNLENLVGNNGYNTSNYQML